MENLIRRSIGPGITLETLIAPELWTALIDPHQLEHALLNLCINASDAMPEGGTLSIVTANIASLSAAPDRLPPGDFVLMRVTDTGSGMTKEVMERAFEPFFTTKPAGQGTGLGLSMIYGFIRQSGGEVHIRSAPGQGTCVRLYFPRHAGAPEPMAPAAMPALPAKGGAGETVLIVDDEASLRVLMQEVLEEQGYTTLAVEDGAAALTLLQSPQPIDLLLTDVGLPGGISGVQLAEAANNLRPRLKTLFITGYGDNALIRRDRLAAGTHILPKPFTMAALAARVREMLTIEEV
jgi:CheY-like chemotaxis protein